MRLTGKYYTGEGFVREIKLRLVVEDLPDGAAVTLTDIQLQADEDPTGLVPNPEEAGTPTGKTTYRNGVIHDDQTVVALANIDNATPMRIQVERARGEDVKISTYHFGEMNGGIEWADGRTFRASKGYGRVPIVTARSDLHLPVHGEGRSFLRAEWTDRAPDDSGSPI